MELLRTEGALLSQSTYNGHNSFQEEKSMKYWWEDKDPEGLQESKKYETPAPSRTFILQYLNERAIPLRYEQLCSAFALDHSGQLEALRRRLIAMCRDGQLIQNRKRAYCLPDKIQLISGKVQGHRDGFGFLIPDDGSQDFFLTPKQMESLFDGDKVMVRETEIDNRQRRWCVVVEVLERAFIKVVGVYHEEEGVGFVVPDHHRLNHEVVVLAGSLKPTQGQYVVVEIKDYPGRKRSATGYVKEILGFQHEKNVEIEVAIRSHNIPANWPKAVVKMAKGFYAEVREEDKRSRVDLRNLPLVTIDGEFARDFDDAVYAERKKSGGWRLYVAIADVSHYVIPKDALDKEALKRGNSVYFPGRVIPMLPEVLSNGLCSLNPHTDRLAIVCEMTVSQQGKLSGFTFYEGLIQSHARLTYTEVSAILEKPDSDEGKQYRKQFSSVVKPLEVLFELYNALKKTREKRGAIDFDTVETQIIFDSQRKIEAIVPVKRNQAHKLIEECMLCANQATAKFFEKHALPALYRVHNGPTDKKLEQLYGFLGELSLSLPGKSKPEPGDYQKLLLSIQDRPDVNAIQTSLLRSLSQAEYHPENTGHFGLAFQAYTHFTSPIRRYPDLLAHRAIRHIIRSDISSRHVRRVKNATLLNKKIIYPYAHKDIADVATQCSYAERRADDATRDATMSLKCQYIKRHVGEVFVGTIGSVTGFGLFVELDDIYVSGLVHVSSLPDDYYHFDQAKQRLMGEHSRRTFKLGDKLKVRVVRVNIEEKNIDFEPEEIAKKKKGKSVRSDKRSSAGRSKKKLMQKAAAKADKESKKRKGTISKKSGRKKTDPKSASQKQKKSRKSGKNTVKKDRNSTKNVVRSKPKKK